MSFSGYLPFLLNTTIHHHLKNSSQTDPDVVAQLLKDFYVDDLITGACDETKALHHYETCKKIKKAGEFNFRKFVSSSSYMQTRISGIKTTDEHHSIVSSCITEADETFVQCKLFPWTERVWDEEGTGSVLGHQE